MRADDPAVLLGYRLARLARLVKRLVHLVEAEGAEGVEGEPRGYPAHARTRRAARAQHRVHALLVAERARAVGVGVEVGGGGVGAAGHVPRADLAAEDLDEADDDEGEGPCHVQRAAQVEDGHPQRGELGVVLHRTRHRG
eukprot:CAMPEP_0118845492 /NCGR_PEP_ID=MMETSP1162-20130426/89354_1 /TAXON_ID=33656 /ORGANISM="Phaeocystis Sp, Strain CCMP2710" /LENGTH=139 /DNA_ID=CAMNT_0006777643 /DNA_START=202 /DNA_END=617 /DNA_ORIENTATION=+